MAPQVSDLSTPGPGINNVNVVELHTEISWSRQPVPLQNRRDEQRRGKVGFMNVGARTVYEIT